MSIARTAAVQSIEKLLQEASLESLVERISPVSTDTTPLPDPIPAIRSWGEASRLERAAYIERLSGVSPKSLMPIPEGFQPESLKGNIENFIGMTQIPTGIIGPLRVNGTAAKGDFLVPLATTEGALVASYHRGATVMSKAGGATSVCLLEMVQRTPTFRFRTFAETGAFLIWALKQFETLKQVVREHTSHGALEEMRPNIDGNQITFLFDFSTGDASGQNMSTICTEAICHYFIEHTPIQPVKWYVEGNLSGDKKATAQSFSSVRGKKVTTEVIIPRALVASDLHTTPEDIMAYWKTSIVNSLQSGAIGVNGHYANGIAAIFAACGQDIACVAEACVGTTRFDVTPSGELYASATLPNLIVGTIGGGTGLPTQRECLEIMHCAGPGTARKFAEIVAAALLGGEISIVAAIASDEFSKAHSIFGRRRSPNPEAIPAHA